MYTYVRTHSYLKMYDMAMYMCVHTCINMMYMYVDDMDT